MRNIKTSLRFVRNSALLFVAASGMTYLSACSETDINPDNGGNNGDDNVLVQSLKVTTGSNPSLAKTYRNSHQIGTRGALRVPQMPTLPTQPSAEQLNAMNLVGNGTNMYNYQNYSGNPDFYVKGDVKLSQLPTKVQCAGTEATNWQGFYTEGTTRYFIDGNVEIDGFGGNESDPMEIYILNGGKLTSGQNIPYATTIYLYGGADILKAGNDGEIYHKGKLIAEAPLDHPDTDITVEGDIYTTAKIHGKDVKLIGGEVYAGCSVTAENTIYLTGENSVINAGYVSAPTITLSSNNSLEILLRDGGYLNATSDLNLTNVGNLYIYAEDGEYAMVETKNLSVQNEDLTGTFMNVAVKFDTTKNSTDLAGSRGEGLFWNESTMINGDIYYEVADTNNECAPKYVWNPNDPDSNPNDPDPTKPDPTKPDPTKPDPVTPDPDGPELENIGSLEPTGDHTHPISATCIFTTGTDAYVSWHTQGTNFHGCIEYLTVDKGEVTLNAFLETSPSNDIYGAIDFNHVYFDKERNRLFVAGDHPKKGGILGWINCPDGKFTTGDADLFLKELYNGEGGSGNCIIRNGNYYQVASVKGFETYNVSDFELNATSNRAVARLAAYDFDPAGESATGRQTGKHIATDGDNVVMLTLINRDNSTNTATASIKVYSAKDVDYKTCLASYVVNDAVLSPVDGKDVIAINGEDIYVCLGKGGVQHLKFNGSAITKYSEFALADMTKEELAGIGVSAKEAEASCANGLAIGDDDYLYVAHGGAGLVVLKKDDLSFVTRTRYNGGNSANYISIHPNGYIYVAYGKSKVQVYAWKNK